MRSSCQRGSIVGDVPPASHSANRRRPHPLRKRTSDLLAVLALLAAAGCGQSDRPSTYPVHGAVTLDGNPLSFGGVRFVSDDGRLAKAKIQSDGSYTLSTFEDGDGAIPGSYRISVQVRKMKEETADRPAWPGPSLIPEKYEDPTTSGLQFEVVPGENQYDIELSSKP